MCRSLVEWLDFGFWKELNVLCLEFFRIKVKNIVYFYIYYWIFVMY